MRLRADRRTFLYGAASAASLLAIRAGANTSSADAWQRAADIARKVRAPTFPDRLFDITKYGARPDCEFNGVTQPSTIKHTRSVNLGKVRVNDKLVQTL